MPDAPAAKSTMGQSTTGHVNPYSIGVVPASDYDPEDFESSSPVYVHRVSDANSNSAALLSFVFGLLAVAVTLVTFLPDPKTYWVAGSGAIAVLLGIIAIAQRVSGRSTNSWAPIVGILLGGTATALVVMGVSILGPFNLAPGGLQPASSTTATSQSAPPAASTEPFVFPGNPVLTANGSVAQQVATAMNRKYASGKPTLGAGESWPATIKLTGSQVISPDGSVLATIPTGHSLGYSLSTDHSSYTVTVAGANSTEAASYSSAVDRFSFRCAATDTDCAQGN
jgi:hypothetical protein